MTRILVLCLATAGWLQATVPVVVSPRASAIERLAGEELARYLGRLYPDQQFVVRAEAPHSGPSILIRTDPRLKTPESFAITGSGSRAIIAGADPAGALYGVYALLEKLGFGFFLSEDAAPAPRKGAPRLEEWQLSDAPLVRDRIVFNWHNFLSSAAAWELEDWQSWIAQSAKMRFNTIMVHAYGNNPMFTFRFGGLQKPVGYLATTARGRDWGTQHVNDVRRLFGGEIFPSPVFGASVALTPEERRTQAAIELMQRVFAFARTRGMHVTFALDVDTESSNPQEIINTLPASARLTDGKFQLANPETPEGYAYYREQVRQLLAMYPEIDRLAVWFRNGATPWRNVTPERFPESWKAEFEAALQKNPGLRGDKDAHGMFVVAKLVRAFGKALREAGRADVELATGSWRLPFLGAGDFFMPRDATLLPLDWETIFDTEQGQKQLQAVRSRRKLVPIVWAHHDDRTYIGRPYTPFQSFSGLLKSSGSAGFGIIHWTTRPLDFYFKSLGVQVWKQTQDQPLAETCARIAAQTFGPAGKEIGAQYLLRWITGAPMFGRETSNRFIDVPLKDPEDTMAKARQRLELLSRVDEGGLSAEQKERLNYYRDFEQFVLGFFRCHSAWERAQGFLKKADTAGARTAVASSDPAEVIRQYARMSARGRMSRGEQALIVSLNLRWLPYMLSLRQAVGMDAIRIKFGPTQHEPLAQGAGANTFYFDAQRRVWKVLGEKETGAPAASGDDSELCGSGIRIEKPLSLRLAPIAGDRLSPGEYRLSLLLASGGKAEVVAQGHAVDLTRPIAIAEGHLDLTIRPAGGPVLACGAVLEPAGLL